jgi:hypothetical protein
MNKSKLKKIVAFCTEVKTEREPKTQEEWEICKKAHGDGFNTFSVKEFKGIAKAMGAKIKITNREKTPLALFYNLKSSLKRYL